MGCVTSARRSSVITDEDRRLTQMMGILPYDNMTATVNFRNLAIVLGQPIYFVKETTKHGVVTIGGSVGGLSNMGPRDGGLFLDARKHRDSAVGAAVYALGRSLELQVAAVSARRDFGQLLETLRSLTEVLS